MSYNSDENSSDDEADSRARTPSLLTNAVLPMDLVHAYWWVARPSRTVGSPLPVIVLMDAGNSTLSPGTSNGRHASCVGETCTRGLRGEKFDSS